MRTLQTAPALMHSALQLWFIGPASSFSVGLSTEGIYRVSGNKSEMESLQRQFDQGKAQPGHTSKADAVAELCHGWIALATHKPEPEPGGYYLTDRGHLWPPWGTRPVNILSLPRQFSLLSPVTITGFPGQAHFSVRPLPLWAGARVIAFELMVQSVLTGRRCVHQPHFSSEWPSGKKSWGTCQDN